MTALPDETPPGVADLLAQARHELDRVDHKAELIFAGSGVATGVIIAGVVAGDTVGGMAPAARLAWSAGAAAWFAGLMLLGMSIYPRIRRNSESSPGAVGYFGDVVRYSDLERLREAIERASRNKIDIDVDQLLRISRLVVGKYRLVRSAIWLLGGGALCVVLATAGDGLMRHVGFSP